MGRSDATILLDADTRPIEAALSALSRRRVTLGGVDAKAFTGPLGKINGSLGEFEKSLAASNARVLAFGASAGAIMALQRGFSELVKATIMVEKQLAQINVVLGASERNLAKFGNSLFEVAKNTEQSFEAVAEAATEFSRQGLGMEKTLKRVQDAMILTRLTGLEVVDSVNAITAALNGFSSAALDSTQVVNKLIAVDQAFAVSGKDLAEAIRRVGSTAEGAGVSLEQLIAVVTSAQQITARGGAVIGNSFKTIFTRLQRPRTLEALDQLGIKVKDLRGNVLPAMAMLENLAKGFDSLSQAQQSQVAELVGGVFQINVLKASLKDLGREYSIYGSALGIANSATNEASLRNEQLNKTLSAQVNEAVQNITKLAAAVGELTIGPALENILGAVNSFLGDFDPSDAESAGNQIGSALLKGFGTFLSGPGLLAVGVGLFKIFQFLSAQAKDAAKTILLMGTGAEKRANSERAVLQYLQKEPALMEQILKGTVSIDTVHDRILKDLKDETALMVKQEAAARRISTLLMRSGVGSTTRGGAPVLVAAGGYVPNFANKAFEAERQQARALGAPAGTIPHFSKGTIAGQRFVMNSNEIEIPNFGRNGDSLVIPNYAFPKSQGFNQLNKASEKALVGSQVAGIRSQRENRGKYGPASLDLNNTVGMIFSRGGGAIGFDATGAGLEKAGIVGAQKALGKTGKYPIRGITPIPILPAAGKNPQLTEQGSEFSSLIERPLGRAIKEIALKLGLPASAAGALPSTSEAFRQIQRDKSAYPNFAGRILEAVISTALRKDLKALDSDVSGHATWDYRGANFRRRKMVTESIFGEGNANKLFNTLYVDSKTHGGMGAPGSETRRSMLGKILSTGLYRNTIQAQVNNRLNAAGGYIPNFAANYADAREQSYGREMKALMGRGFTRQQAASVIREHKDGAGFTRAITNTVDEPNGLSDVKQKSKIPNFADPPAGGDDASKAAANQMRLMVASMAIPMVVEGLSALGAESESAKESMSTLGAGLGTAFMAMMLLQDSTKKISGMPMGNVIGGAIAVGAAFHALASYLSKKKFDGIINAAKEAEVTLTQFNENSQKATTAYQNLTEELKKSTPDSDVIQKAQNDLAQAIAALPQKYRALMNSATSLDAAQQILAKGQAELAKQTKSSTFAKTLAEAQKETTGFFGEGAGSLYGAGRRKKTGSVAGVDTGMAAEIGTQVEKGATVGVATAIGAALGAIVGGVAGFFAGGVGAAPGAVAGAKGGAALGATIGAIDAGTGAYGGELETEVFKDGKVSVEASVNELANSLDFAAVSADVAAGRVDFMAMSNDRFADVLVNAYGASEILGDQLRNMANGDIALLQGKLQLLAIQTNSSQKAAERLAEISRRAAIEQNAYADAIAQQEGAIRNALGGLQVFSEKMREITQLRSDLQRDFKLKVAEGGLKLGSNFMTEEKKAETQFGIAEAGINSNFVKDMAKAQEAGMKAVLASATKALGGDKADPKVMLQLEQIRARRDIKNTQDLITALNGITVNGQKVLQSNKEFATAIQAGMNTQAAEIQKANIVRQHQLRIAELNLHVAKEQARIQKNIETLGGVGTFRDPEAAEASFEQFEDGLKAFLAGTVRGEDVQAGRGAFDILKSVQNAGIDVSGNQDIQQMIKDANSEFIQGTLSDRATRLDQTAGQLRGQGFDAQADQLEKLAEALRERAAESDTIAADQISAEFKSDKMPANIAAMLDEIKHLNSLTQQEVQSRRKDFEDALRAEQVGNRLVHVRKAIEIMAATQAAADAAKAASEAEKEASAAKAEVDAAREITSGDAATARIGAAQVAAGTTGYGTITELFNRKGSVAQELGVHMGVERPGMTQSQMEDETVQAQLALEEMLKAIQKGSGGRITSLEQMSSLGKDEMKEFLDKGGYGGHLERLGLDRETGVHQAGNIVREMAGVQQTPENREFFAQMNEMLAAAAKLQAGSAERKRLASANEKSRDAQAAQAAAEAAVPGEQMAQIKRDQAMAAVGNIAISGKKERDLRGGQITSLQAQLQAEEDAGGTGSTRHKKLQDDINKLKAEQLKSVRTTLALMKAEAQAYNTAHGTAAGMELKTGDHDVARQYLTDTGQLGTDRLTNAVKIQDLLNDTNIDLNEPTEVSGAGVTGAGSTPLPVSAGPAAAAATNAPATYNSYANTAGLPTELPNMGAPQVDPNTGLPIGGAAQEMQEAQEGAVSASEFYQEQLTVSTAIQDTLVEIRDALTTGQVQELLDKLNVLVGAEGGGGTTTGATTVDFTALPLDVTVSGEVGTIISNENRVAIERAIIQRLIDAKVVSPEQAATLLAPTTA